MSSAFASSCPPNCPLGVSTTTKSGEYLFDKSRSAAYSRFVAPHLLATFVTSTTLPFIAANSIVEPSSAGARRSWNAAIARVTLPRARFERATRAGANERANAPSARVIL